MSTKHTIATCVCTLALTLVGHAPKSQGLAVAVATDAACSQVVAPHADAGVQPVVITDDLADPAELLLDGSDVQAGFAVPPWWQAALRDLRGPPVVAVSLRPPETHSIALVLRC